MAYDRRDEREVNEFFTFSAGGLTMHCPACSAVVPEDARFCPQCGILLSLPAGPQSPESLSGRVSAPRGFGLSGLGRFFVMLLASMALSLLLSAVFGFPVFILGAVLPLFWWRKAL